MAVQQQLTAWQSIRPFLRKFKRLLEGAVQPLFQARGYPAHGFGYYWRKQQDIKHMLDPGNFNAEKLANGYGVGIDERIVEFPWFLSRISPEGGRLLDAGSAVNHKFLLNHAALQNKEIFISTLAPENDAWWRRGISYVYEDFRSSCFRDNYFDSIVCISTLEHVGLDNTLLYTSDNSKSENSKDDTSLVMLEFKRMLRPGGKLYLTFPYGKHHNYGWFQVFDANGVASLAKSFMPKERKDHYYGYGSTGWFSTTPESLTDVEYHDPQTALKPASDGAAGARGLACLEWTV